MSMRARVVAGATAVALAASGGVAYADGPSGGYLHFPGRTQLTTESGLHLSLPPGYFLDEPTHDKLDTEVKRLQDQETRLVAENQSLKKSLSSWQPGWVTIVSFLAAGIAGGVYLHSKL